MQEARFWVGARDNSVRCLLCPRKCLIADKAFGHCGVRGVRDGKLFAASYGRIAALQMDPVSKKPFARYHSDEMVLSVGLAGCNLDCLFCQNYSLSGLRGAELEQVQALGRIDERTPEELASLAAEDALSVGLAFTYNEPLTAFEYVLDTFKNLRKFNSVKKHLLVTNGVINEEPLKKLLPLLDAANIDLKGGADFYGKICGATPAVYEAVRRNIKLCNDAGVHVEVCFLVIDGLNDDEGTVREIVDFLAGVNPEIVLHVNRYFPRYKMKIPPTKIETMKRVREIAEEKLKYVCLGNV
jgi:pyruvate formate lyase activating enzyme